MPRLSVNAHLASRRTLDLAVQAGCRGVRIDGVWAMMQPARDVWDWTLLDESVVGAAERNLEVLVTLNGTPAWANGGHERNVPPIEISDWQTFVKAVCERYRGQIGVLEIFNEPNIFGYWTGTAEQYVNYLLIPAIDVIRAAAPGIKIAAPALSTEGDWRPWLDTMLNKSRHLIDLISVHCYAKHGRAVWDALSEPPTWWEALILRKGPCVKDVIGSAGAANLPLWLTETGWSTHKVSEAEQASYFDQLLEGWATQPWVENLFAYQLIDERYPVLCGLFRENGSPKPVVQVMQQRQGDIA